MKEIYLKIKSVIEHSYLTFIIGVAIWILLCWIIASDLRSGHYIPEVGEVISFTVKAPYDLTFNDNIATEEDRDIVESRVKNVYTTNRSIVIKSVNTIDSIFKAIENKDKNSEILKNMKLSEEIWKTDNIQNIKNDIIDIVKDIMNSRITDKNVSRYIKKAIIEVSKRSYYKYLPFLSRVFKKVIVPNQDIDNIETQIKKKKARKSVQPIMRVIRKGEAIIEDGHVITNDVKQTLEAYGFYNIKSNFIKTFFGIALMLAFFFVVTFIYLYKFLPAVLEDESSLLMIEVIIAAAVILIKVGQIIVNKNIVIEQLANISIFSIYAIPVAAASMLICVLIHTKFAILATIIISSLGGIITGSIDFFIISIFAGIVSVYVVLDLKQRGDFIHAGTFVSISNILLIISFSLMKKDVYNAKTISMFTRDIVWGAANGILSSVLAMGFLPYAESMFKVSSVLKLLELANVNQYLLRELSIYAPGTYNHSIIVGNLAAEAAEVVGVNPLLCRVAGYYHDIGKMKRPYFFIENQTTSENLHDGYTANLSATIISAHVKDGAQIAKENNLPEEIIDAIKEHHGTTLIRFFYNKAIENSSKEDDVDEIKFSYAGPKPQSKMTAIIMLADCIESAVRVLSEKTPGKIQKLVHNIIESKQEDKQLNESDLTMKDLEDIATCFVKKFNGMYHKRIEYPELDKAKVKTNN